MNSPYLEVSQKEFNQLVEWERRFVKANKISLLAFRLRNQIDNVILTRRVDFAWQKVKEVEPLPTFDENKNLISNARFLLNCIKLNKVWFGKIIKIKKDE